MTELFSRDPKGAAVTLDLKAPLQGRMHDATPAWISGARVTCKAAVEEVGRRLATARTPLLTGAPEDVATLRAAFRLAALTGASVDCMGSEGLYADLSVMASSGAMMTTPAEARARADIVLLIGRAAADPLTDFVCSGPPRRGVQSGTARKLLTLGSVRDGATVIRADDGLVPTLGLLRAALAVRKTARSEHKDVTQQLRGARFGVVIYDPGELGEIGVDMVLGLIRDLNEASRFSGLALAHPAARLALAVGAWSLGQGFRSGFGRGRPEHDPWRFNAARLLRMSEADALVWIGADLGAFAPPHGDRLAPVMALLPDPEGNEADIVIAVARPGVDIPAVVWNAVRATMTFRAPSRLREDVPATSVVLASIADVVSRERNTSC